MFLLKKFVAAFLLPFPIFLLFMAFGFYFFSQKRYVGSKRFFLVGILWIILLSYAPFSSLLLLPLERQFSSVDLNGTNAGYIHVLGTAHVAREGIPLSSELDPSGLARVTEGVLLYKQHKGMKLVFSGYGKDEPLSNAKCSAALAQALGVREEDIIVFETPKDTLEEAGAMSEMAQGKHVVLVTSASHMLRASRLFKKAGIKVIEAPTDFKVKKPDDLLQLPGAEGLRRSETAFHEYLGLLWFWLKGDI
ncbi:ElyC/SanA/YdcF family protein [Sulfurovum sp. NBC37-1]|uniref:ElyC/SanA/YdcF family protein n=1 Tax=Sulfurovum sp. (strain NBC37-1) TaxID=387093 RepID=UPI0001587BA6|nr:ElyC/SanA/YdcF family protein [Sulfurovum sp. NBC37-1]BAF72502.1 conserved hypothetical protein [Sulfurovum sp. NBC37-1]